MAETLAPATIESKTGADITTLRAKRFVAQAGRDGRLSKLLGHSGVDIRRQTNHENEETISAAELAATFDPHGEWDTLDETGNVHFSQAGREATAANAHVVRATDTVTLEGAPVISDSMSRSTAGEVVFNQRTGELSATGGVVSTYMPTAEGDAVSLGSGAAHISADKLSGSASSGHVVYAGHARLWQGAAVLDCDQIEVWRDAKKMQATGHVVAVFPRLGGHSLHCPETSSRPGKLRLPNQSCGRFALRCSRIWLTRAKPTLKAACRLTPARAPSNPERLDVFLGPATAASSGAQPLTGASSSTSPERRPESQVTAVGRQLSRVVAEGDVVVRQGDRRGMADQAEYTAAEGKFVLSGGQPTLANAFSDTTTGHSLTFFVASDTILIDSQEGSRTLTKHRIEK